jgi:hypothetical protein
VELYLHSPNTPSLRGSQLQKKAQGQIYLTFTFKSLSSEVKTVAEDELKFPGIFVSHRVNIVLICCK